MKTLLTIMNRGRNHDSHKIHPYTNELSLPANFYKGKKTSNCDGGTCLIYIFAYIVCNCIFCPICFLIWSPMLYYISISINPHPSSSPTLSPTMIPTTYATLYNYTF